MASSKLKHIQECENKQLIDELSKMPPMVIATAYLHAINYTIYGEDVTEKWVTAIQNASALEKAYRVGYHDALQNQAMPIDTFDKIRTEIEELDGYEDRYSMIHDRPSLVRRVRNDCLKIIDKYKAESEVSDANSN